MKVRLHLMGATVLAALSFGPAAGCGDDDGGTNPVCGNGVVEVGEQCDDGNNLNGDGCSGYCQNESTTQCGNGLIEAGEQCDDGNTASGDGCSATCQNEGAALCGNGTVETGEQCDDGNTTGGDGCSATCQNEGAAVCGNGTVETGEQCDDGNTTGGDGCSPTCQEEACGNGVLDAGEQCDDGNNDNTDACPDGVGGTCANATCGDGFVRTGVEGCDDGNNTSGDGCSATCDLEGCGDGVVQAGETCDDGNGINTDGCPDGVGGTCQIATCGDGFQWAGHEGCDDGNLLNNDGCSATCADEVCGDGIVQTNEACDDGNLSDGDGCESDCTVTGCSEPTDCGNVNLFVCDVISESCQASQCTVAAGTCGTGCAGTDPCCLEQSTGTGQGACYEICDPYDTACPTGLECYDVTTNQGAGYCMNPGTALVGAPCTPTITNTGCAPGGVCLNSGGNDICFEQCDFFGTPSCSGGRSCYPSGYCATALSINAATYGQVCAAGAAGDPCHPNGAGFGGLCQDNAGSLECFQLCQLWSRSGAVTPCVTGTCTDAFIGDTWEGDIGHCY